MTNADTWGDFLDRVSNDSTDTAISRKSGISGSTIGRWRSGAVHPKPLQAVAIARAYDVHPLSALVAAGYLTYEDVDVVINHTILPKSFALDDFTTLELLSEVSKRVERNA